MSKEGISQVRDCTMRAPQDTEFLHPHKCLLQLNNSTAFPLDWQEPRTAPQPWESRQILLSSFFRF